MYEVGKVYAIEFGAEMAEIGVYRILEKINVFPKGKTILKTKYLGDIFKMNDQPVFSGFSDSESITYLDMSEFMAGYEVSEHYEVKGYSFDSTILDYGEPTEDLAINGPKWLSTDYARVI